MIVFVLYSLIQFLYFQSEVWICMELMATCLDKLLKKTKRPIPERILGKMAVAVSIIMYPYSALLSVCRQIVSVF